MSPVCGIFKVSFYFSSNVLDVPTLHSPIRLTINQPTKESRQRAGPICEGCLGCLDKDNTRLQMEGDSWEEGGGVTVPGVVNEHSTLAVYWSGSVL